MTNAKQTNVLKGQRLSGIVLIVVGIFHTAAHVLLPQPREALAGMVRAGLVNTMGPDWAAANFSVFMSMIFGFALLIMGTLVCQTARIPWKLPLSTSIAITLLFVFIVTLGPNSGGWLALPSCGFLLYQSIKAKKSA